MSETERKPLDADYENKRVSYHEAGHAVVYWNLGVGVQRVWIDRIRHCGKTFPLRGRKGRIARTGEAVACAAGLTTLKYLEPTIGPHDIMRADVDLRLALAAFLTTEHLSDGEQLGVAYELIRRTWTLMDTPELKRQVRSLVPPLVKQGCLFQREVEMLLRALPDSSVARHRCQAFVEEVEDQREEIIASARGFAPDFAWKDLSREGGARDTPTDSRP